MEQKENWSKAEKIIVLFLSECRILRIRLKNLKASNTAIITNNSNQKAESEPNIESRCQREWRNRDVYRFARACLSVWLVNKFNLNEQLKRKLVTQVTSFPTIGQRFCSWQIWSARAKIWVKLRHWSGELDFRCCEICNFLLFYFTSHRITNSVSVAQLSRLDYGTQTLPLGQPSVESM